MGADARTTTDLDTRLRLNEGRNAVSKLTNRVTSAYRAAECDRVLALLGVLGLALAAIIFGVMLVRGNTRIPPEGDLTKSLTFDAALGIYYLTLAFYLPRARFSPGARRLWLRAVVFFALYSYSVETVQIFRGIDPRFSEAGSSWDTLLGILFGLVAVGQIVVFVVLALRFFRLPASLVVLAIRYASGATMVAFAAGIWMSVIQGREVGEAGNLLPLHALGFHALQAIPLLGWLLERSSLPGSTARRLVHVAGAGWIAACLAVAWQTRAGRSLADPSLAVLAALVLLLLWGGALLVAVSTRQRALEGRTNTWLTTM
jgi:hypothetical protein